MASGQTPSERYPDRPGESDTGTTSDNPTTSHGNSSESETAPARMNAARSSQSTTPTYAESERDGWPSGPTRAPETDAAVAAASAAAAAAVAAVSAAIAANSATNARASN